MSKYNLYEPYDRLVYKEMFRYEYERSIRDEQIRRKMNAQAQILAHPGIMEELMRYAEEDARTYGLIVNDQLKDNESEEETEDMVTKREQDGQAVRKPSHKEDISVQLQNLSIMREGNKIIVPLDMPYETVIEAMKMKIAEDEKNIDLLFDFQLMVPEGALALFRSLNDIYGFVKLMNTPGFFGPEPPTILTVQVSKDRTEMIPWGRFGVPGIKGYIETNINWLNEVPYFQLKANIPSKHKMDIQQIVDFINARHDSVYKGAAIKVKFPPLAKKPPVTDFFPTFMDLSDVSPDQLIFSREVADIVDTTLFTPICKTEFCRANDIPLKRGILLEGPPGVGKTLTAAVVASMSQKHGWTFIQNDDVKDLPRVYKFAMHHQPAIIFCEDLDLVLKEATERDDIINNILNSIDGIESKNLEILLVLTTNFVGKITKASLRPGRIDAVVPVRPPDSEAVQRLIRLYAKERMAEGEDLTEAGALLAGKNAAVVREVVERSKLSAVRRLTSPDQQLTISARDIVVAALGMEAHNKLLEPEAEDKRSPIEKAAAILVDGINSARTAPALNGQAHGHLSSSQAALGAPASPRLPAES